MNCYHCQHPLADWGLSTCCDRCLRYQHICLTCKYYDSHQAHGCSLYEADPPADKEAKNSCEFHCLKEFDPTFSSLTDSTSEKCNKAELSPEEKFSNLFKD